MRSSGVIFTVTLSSVINVFFEEEKKSPDDHVQYFRVV